MQSSLDLLKGVARANKEAEALELESEQCMDESRRLTSYIRALMSEEFNYRREGRQKAREARRKRREARRFNEQYLRFEYQVADPIPFKKFGD